MIDILLSFRHLASGTTTSGFLTDKPQPVKLEEAKTIVSELQSALGAGQVEHITLFTRITSLIFHVHGTRDSQPAEVTISESLIKGSVMTIQIIEVDAA